MKNQNFVITSLQVWDIVIGSSIKNVALEISKNNKVLYVNTPLDISTWLKGGDSPSYVQRSEVIKGKRPILREIKENLWVLDCSFIAFSINFMKPPAMFNFFNKINNKRIAKAISKATKQLNLDNFIHIADTDIYRSFYLKEMLKPKISAYYRRDHIIGEPYWKRHGTRLEPLLCQKSDAVLANSLHFANELKRYNKNTYAIETGVDLELYDATIEHKMPNDVAQIIRPIVGYIGTVNRLRLDADLLVYLSESRPQYSFVFTGPVDDFFKTHKLYTLPNVHFLGNKQVKELSSYINAYDICINPQVVNDMTIGNYPLKIDEYLALGKPTVATRTNTMEHLFSEHVWLAQSKEEYLEYIDNALKEVGDNDKREERIRYAKTHTWENSVKKIYKAIEELL